MNTNMKCEAWLEQLPLKALRMMVDEIVLNCDYNDCPAERRPFVMRVCAEINRRERECSGYES